MNVNSLMYKNLIKPMFLYYINRISIYISMNICHIFARLLAILRLIYPRLLLLFVHDVPKYFWLNFGHTLFVLHERKFLKMKCIYFYNVNVNKWCYFWRDFKVTKSVSYQVTCIKYAWHFTQLKYIHMSFLSEYSIFPIQNKFKTPLVQNILMSYDIASKKFIYISLRLSKRVFS